MGRQPKRDPREAMQLFVENALSSDPPARLVDEIVAYRMANPPDPAGWYAQASAGAAHDALARLGDIRIPTLVVHGTADNVVDAGNAPQRHRTTCPLRSDSFIYIMVSCLKSFSRALGLWGPWSVAS